jgi:thiol:disulfide interchange protein DsbD
VLGATQLVGVVSGGRDPLAPLAHFTAARRRSSHWPSPASRPWPQLDAALGATGGKTAMLDFYADWCVSCKEMEKLTFVDPACAAPSWRIPAAAGGRDGQRRRRPPMLKRFGLFGPPGIILFDRAMGGRSRIRTGDWVSG